MLEELDELRYSICKITVQKREELIQSQLKIYLDQGYSKEELLIVTNPGKTYYGIQARGELVFSVETEIEIKEDGSACINLIGSHFIPKPTGGE